MTVTIVKKDQLQAEVERHLDTLPTFLRDFVNMTYSSGIKTAGDTVTVETVPDIVVSTGGTPGAAITAQNVTITGTNIVADQVDQLNIPVTDFESATSNLNLMSQLANRVAYGIKQRMETYFFGLHTSALAANELDDGDLATATGAGSGAAATISTANVYEMFALLAEKLEDNEADLDMAGVFIRPAIKSLLVQAGLASGADIGMADGKKGLIANIAGLDVYVNNNVPTGFVIALDKHAVHGVSKYAKTDVRENPDGFSANIIAENIFGGAVLPNGAKRMATFAVTNY